MTTATRSRAAAPPPAPPASAGSRPGDGLVVERLSLTYPSERGAPVPALDGVSLTARAGELVAVVGPSGCGKTTLLEVVCGLLRPDGGSVSGPPAVLMPQRDLLLPWLDALENAALSLRLAGQRRGDALLAAGELFAELGLDGFEKARPQELSGGMRQRVAFARTLLSGKPLLCLDEPFGALDAITRGEMQQWLARSLEREPRTVLLVTHDVEEAIVLCDRVVVLSRRAGARAERARGAARAPATGRRPRGGSAARGRAGAAGGGHVVRRSLRRIAPAALLAVALLGLWELYCDLGGVEAVLLPAPHAVASALWDNAGLLAHNFAVTAEEVVLGLLLAVGAGLAMAVAIHLSPLLRRAFYPLAVGSQAVPIPVIGVLLVFWWGFGIFPKLVVIALICFFPVLVTTIDALASLDPERAKLLRTLDASRWQTLRFAELPGGTAGGPQRRQDRARRGRDRSLHRRDQHAHDRHLHRARAGDRARRGRLPDRARVRRHGAAVRVRDRLLLQPGGGRTAAGALAPRGGRGSGPVKPRADAAGGPAWRAPACWR